jgi:hypothetical protein
MSSTAMESFTQADDVNGQANCFSCHDTSFVFSDIGGQKLLNPKRLNVSHALSHFVQENSAPTGSPTPSPGNK